MDETAGVAMSLVSKHVGGEVDAQMIAPLKELIEQTSIEYQRDSLMTDTARPDGGRAALAGFVTNRLGRATPRPAPVKAASPAGKSAAQNFENLPGYRELKLQRQAARADRSGQPVLPRP